MIIITSVAVAIDIIAFGAVLVEISRVGQKNPGKVYTPKYHSILSYKPFPARFSDYNHFFS